MPCWKKKDDGEPDPECPDVKKKEIPPKKPAPVKEKEPVLV